jgi:hypothetical protein
MSAEYNFNFPLNLSKLQNERLELVPFDVSGYSSLDSYAYTGMALPSHSAGSSRCVSLPAMPARHRGSLSAQQLKSVRPWVRYIALLLQPRRPHFVVCVAIVLNLGCKPAYLHVVPQVPTLSLFPPNCTSTSNFSTSADNADNLPPSLVQSRSPRGPLCQVYDRLRSRTR